MRPSEIPKHHSPLLTCVFMRFCLQLRCTSCFQGSRRYEIQARVCGYAIGVWKGPLRESSSARVSQDWNALHLAFALLSCLCSCKAMWFNSPSHSHFGFSPRLPKDEQSVPQQAMTEITDAESASKTSPAASGTEKRLPRVDYTDGADMIESAQEVGLLAHSTTKKSSPE
jgi:hypothetical protein